MGTRRTARTTALATAGSSLVLGFDGPSTSTRAAPITARLTNTGDSAIRLLPCPQYAARNRGEARNGGFSSTYPTRFLPCLERARVISPGASLPFRLPAKRLDRGGPDGAVPGSTYSVTIRLAGTRPVTVETTVD